MALIYNGTTVTAVKFGTTNLTKVICNGVTVWESTKTYRYKAAAARYGTTSLNLPSTAGNFSISNQAGMWCFPDATDTTGYGVSLSECMSKTITSMIFYFYRTNTYAYSSPNNTCWTYNVSISNSGMSSIYNRSASYHFDKAPSTPSAAGVMDSGLTTEELKAIFASECRKQYSDSSGSGCNALTAGYYYNFGLRCLYPPSGAVQFRCNNVDYDDAYIEIVASD